MKGRFRRAWIRAASRAGRRERVKLADARRASLDRGGRPCLGKRGDQYSVSTKSKYPIHSSSDSLEKISQSQWWSTAGRKPCNLVVRYIVAG